MWHRASLSGVVSAEGGRVAEKGLVIEGHLDERRAVEEGLELRATVPGVHDMFDERLAFSRIGDDACCRGQIRLETLLEMEDEVGIGGEVRRSRRVSLACR